MTDFLILAEEEEHNVWREYGEMKASNSMTAIREAVEGENSIEMITSLADKGRRVVAVAGRSWQPKKVSQSKRQFKDG